MNSTIDSDIASETATNGSKRWWLILAILFCAGGLSAVAASRFLVASNRGVPEDRIDFLLPSPSLTPESVVRLQMESLRDAKKNPERLVACYSLATPANREITGPFSTFAALVYSEPYVRLITCVDFQIGKPLIEDDSAVVLVSLLSPDNQVSAFRFLLQKQVDDPYSGCWMTEGVFWVDPLALPTANEDSNVDR